MKINKKIVSLLAIISILSVMVFSTLAYFTAEDSALNKITTGNVDIELHDETLNDKEELVAFPEDGFAGIMPGDVVSKVVNVKNTGDNPVWIRVALDKSIIEGLDFDGITLDINTADWTLGEDGWYYYNKLVNPAEVTSNLLTEVSFDKLLGNEYFDAHVEINVSAQAVQSQNNGTTVLEAEGWPQE